jgi:hypothetical protein
MRSALNYLNGFVILNQPDVETDICKFEPIMYITTTLDPKVTGSLFVSSQASRIRSIGNSNSLKV